MKSSKIKKIVEMLFPSNNDPYQDTSVPENVSTEEIMNTIYKKKLWGGRNHDFYSGQGSHLSKIVNPYTKKINQFLESFKTKLTVCDLGCGDFNVGSKLVDSTQKYIGVDIVPELIARNKKQFSNAKLAFECLNIVTDDLPAADCLLVRQVLQHLSNAQIGTVVQKLKSYKYVIVTEHLPKGVFEPNFDKRTGADIRLSQNSGVVLTAPPFDFKPMKERELIQVHIKKGQVVTTQYQNF